MMKELNDAMAHLGLADRWTAEVIELHANVDGHHMMVPITAFIHRDRGIAFGHANSFDGKDDPLGLFTTDIIHVPSRKRMLTVAARLDDAASIALIIASLAPWQQHEDAELLLSTDKNLLMAVLALMRKEFTLVVSGSRNEKRLYERASAVARASQSPAGNA
jgi:hypothetical protein